jgi:hypothetical protein
MVLLLKPEASLATSPEESIDLGGVTVSLGMAKSDVLKRFSASRYTVLSPDDDGLTMVVDRVAKTSYTVRFVGDRLTYASRSWASSYDEALNSSIKALYALADQGGERCTVARAPLNTPSISGDMVVVRCGVRGVSLMRGTLREGGTYGVDEFIGYY